MKLREAAKAWVGGVGAAITAYAGTFTDDVRILGAFAVITAIATYMVPNKPLPAPTGQPVDLAQPNFD